MIELIKEFLNSDCRNSWLNSQEMILYCRKQHIIYKEDLIFCFAVANVALIPASREFRQLKHTGKFREVMKFLEQQCEYIYVESVQTPRMLEIVQKNGYEEISPWNFLKKTGD